MFDIAFSFAGELREFVEDVKRDIVKLGFKVFYDNDFKSELWGSDLTVELPQKYYNSRYVALFLDDNYLNKMWTSFERQILVEKHLEKNGVSYLLPILINDFDKPVPGITKLTGYIRINVPRDKDLLVKLINEKLQSPLIPVSDG